MKVFLPLVFLYGVVMVVMAATPDDAAPAAELVVPPIKKLEACWRDASSRGVGHIPEKENDRKCGKDEEKSGGLCYPRCGDKMVGTGPLCWEDCSKVKYHSSGLVFCCVDDSTCADLIMDLGRKLPESIVKLAIDLAVNPSNVIKILHDFRELVKNSLELGLPMCSSVPSLNDLAGEVVAEVA